jgi:hypothetical protein
MASEFSFSGRCKAMLAPKLLLMWATAACYCAAIVLGAERAGMWHTTAIKETIYWFLGTAAVLAGNATTTHTFDRAFIKRLARKAIRFTIIIEFLINLYVMPLLAELFLVPVVALFVAMQALAENDPKLMPVKKLLDRTLMFIAFGLMLYVTVSAVTDLGALLTREHAEGLLLAPAFTLACVPFLYAIWRWSRWDRDRVMRRWRENEATV